MNLAGWEAAYVELINDVIDYGYEQNTRAGPTRALLGQSLSINMLEGEFPLLTTRKMFPRPVFGELAAFLRGSEKNRDFIDLGCNYWTPNARAFNQTHTPPEDMILGPIYGSQWRRFGGEYDQIAEALRMLRTDPDSRRIVVSAWNPVDLSRMCLPPCHIMFQLHVLNAKLHMSVYMRSVDLCLGLPSDVILYYALLLLFAHDTGYAVGGLHFSFGNAHVYEGHVDTWNSLQRNNKPLVPPSVLLDVPSMFKALDVFRPSDISIIEYENHGAIKYELYA